MRNDLEIARAVAALDARLAADGYRIAQGSEIGGLQASLAALADDSRPARLTPPLDPLESDIDPADLLWLEARDQAGDVVAVQAMKRERISVPLSDHLDRQYHRYYCKGGTAELVGHAPLVDAVTGTIVYHGELFVASSQRGRGVASTFANLAQLLVYQRWDPDFIWGFITHEKVRKGYPMRIGYWRMAPYGTHYSGKPSEISAKDWFVCISRDELSYRVKLGPQRIE